MQTQTATICALAPTCHHHDHVCPCVNPPTPMPCPALLLWCRSLQDFLCLIDVSFNDKVCRTSYLPQCDPPPRTLLEVYEAAVVTAPRVAVYQQMMIELSGRLAGAQAHVAQLEAQLASSNPPLFAAVQVRCCSGCPCSHPPVPLARRQAVQSHLQSLGKGVSPLMHCQAECAVLPWAAWAWWLHGRSTTLALAPVAHHALRSWLGLPSSSPSRTKWSTSSACAASAPSRP
jgi:hypothetical protein